MIKDFVKKNKLLLYGSLKLIESLANPNSRQLDDNEKTIFDTFMKDGIAVIPNFFSAEQCDQCVAEFDKLQTTYGKHFDNDVRIFGIEKHSELINNIFAQNAFLRKIGESVVGETLVFQTTMAGKVNSEKGSGGSGGGWHRDSFSKQFKSIIYLTDVDDDHGPFQFLLGSQALPNIKKVFDVLNRKGPANNARYSDEDIEKVVQDLHLTTKTFTAKKGTLILADTRGLHRGTPIKKGHRYALTNYFIAKSYHRKNNSIENLAKY